MKLHRLRHGGCNHAKIVKMIADHRVHPAIIYFSIDMGEQIPKTRHVLQAFREVLGNQSGLMEHPKHAAYSSGTLCKRFADT